MPTRFSSGVSTHGKGHQLSFFGRPDPVGQWTVFSEDFFKWDTNETEGWTVTETGVATQVAQDLGNSMMGSMVRPMVPARLSPISGARPSTNGRWARIHKATATLRITVPARRRKILERSKSLSPNDLAVGHR